MTTMTDMLAAFTQAYAEAMRDAVIDQPVMAAGAVTPLNGVTHRARIRSRTLDEDTTVWRGLCTCRRGIQAATWAEVYAAIDHHLTSPALTQGDPA